MLPTTCYINKYFDNKFDYVCNELCSHFTDRFCSKILLLRNSLSTQPAECSGMNYLHLIGTEQSWKMLTWRQLQWQQISATSKLIKMAKEKVIWRIISVTLLATEETVLFYNVKTRRPFWGNSSRSSISHWSPPF